MLVEELAHAPDGTFRRFLPTVGASSRHSSIDFRRGREYMFGAFLARLAGDAPSIQCHGNRTCRRAVNNSFGEAPSTKSFSSEENGLHQLHPHLFNLWLVKSFENCHQKSRNPEDFDFQESGAQDQLGKHPRPHEADARLRPPGPEKDWAELVESEPLPAEDSGQGSPFGGV